MKPVIHSDECDGVLVDDPASETWTLVGYASPPGHDHDDNCVKRYADCPKCKQLCCLSIRRRCNVPGCGWIGKAACDRCGGEKLDEWPSGVPTTNPFRD